MGDVGQREALPRGQRRGTEGCVLCNAPGPVDGSQGGGNRSISFVTLPPLLYLLGAVSIQVGGRSWQVLLLLVEYIARTTNKQFRFPRGSALALLLIKTRGRKWRPTLKATWTSGGGHSG